MSLITWLMLGLGAFLLYCAVRGKNPLELASNKLGFKIGTANG